MVQIRIFGLGVRLLALSVALTMVVWVLMRN
jgi:hypothetical protein